MITIKTSTLQSMVGKLSKCSSNKLLEITEFYLFDYVPKKGITMTAYDGGNFIKVSGKVDAEGEEFTCIINANQFSKLVQRTTKDVIKLHLTEECLQVVGNGKYKLAILEGEVYPTFETTEPDKEIEIPTLQEAFATGKSAISSTIYSGPLNGHYSNGDYMFSSNGVKVCFVPIKFVNPVLISATMVNLISAITEPTAKLKLDDNGHIHVVTDTVYVYGPQYDGLDAYPDLMPLLEQKLPHACTIMKKDLVAALDRLTLFVGAYDKDEITVVFDELGMMLYTGSQDTEIIKYQEGTKYSGEFQCLVNGVFLKELANSCAEVITVGYGTEEMIRLESKDVTYLLATGEQDEEEEVNG